MSLNFKRSAESSPLVQAALKSESFDADAYRDQYNLTRDKADGVYVIGGSGGMKGAAVAGGYAALMEQYGLDQPEGVIAASASVGTSSFFLSGQYEAMVKIWASRLSDPKFINASPARVASSLARAFAEQHLGYPKQETGSRIMDVRYLVEQILCEEMGFDAQAMFESPTNFQIPVTDARTGKAVFFGTQERNGSTQITTGEEFRQVAMAAKSLPIASGRSFDIGGRDYLDTYGSGDVTMSIVQAISQGAERIIALPVSPAAGENRNKLPYRMWLAGQSAEFREGYMKEEDNQQHIRRKFSDELTNGGLFRYGGAQVCVVPLIPTMVRTLTTEKKSLQEAIIEGYNRTANNAELRKFLR